MSNGTTTETVRIEIDMIGPMGNPRTLTALVLENGMLRVWLTNPSRTPLSLANLQAKTRVPTVASAGWEQAFFAYADSALGRCTDYRVTTR